MDCISVLKFAKQRSLSALHGIELDSCLTWRTIANVCTVYVYYVSSRGTRFQKLQHQLQRMVGVLSDWQLGGVVYCDMIYGINVGMAFFWYTSL